MTHKYYLRWTIWLIWDEKNGWPCKADSQLGNFKGPGKRSDPCPYANLIMLKLLATRPEKKYQSNIQAGLETALSLWDSLP